MSQTDLVFLQVEYYMELYGRIGHISRLSTRNPVMDVYVTNNYSCKYHGRTSLIMLFVQIIRCCYTDN